MGKNPDRQIVAVNCLQYLQRTANSYLYVGDLMRLGCLGEETVFIQDVLEFV